MPDNYHIVVTATRIFNSKEWTFSVPYNTPVETTVTVRFNDDESLYKPLEDNINSKRIEILQKEILQDAIDALIKLLERLSGGSS